MTETTEPTICPECGGIPHTLTCSRSLRHADREAEYRRVWLERAAACFDYDMRTERVEYFEECAEIAFDAADAFLAELKKRDGG